MVFYSISDVTDKLLSTSGDPIPTLQEDFWISSSPVEPTAPLREVLEDLSPPAMAAFDLACSQCQLWKTGKQLLETAERRLNSSLESRGECAAFAWSLHSQMRRWGSEMLNNRARRKLSGKEGQGERIISSFPHVRSGNLNIVYWESRLLNRYNKFQSFGEILFWFIDKFKEEIYIQKWYQWNLCP